MKYIPIEEIFKKPEVRNVQISPIGNKITYIRSNKDKEEIFINSIDGDNELLIASLTGANIAMMVWAYDNKTLVFQMDHNGNENYRLYTVNTETLEIKAHTPFDVIYVQDVVLNKKNITKMAFKMNKDNYQCHDAYILDLETDTYTKVFNNTGGILQYIYDEDFNVVAYTVQDENGNICVYVKKDETFKMVYEWTLNKTQQSQIIKISKDKRYIEILDNYINDTISYLRVEIDTLEVKVLVSNSNYDITSVVFNPLTDEVESLGVIAYQNSYAIRDNESLKKYEFLNKTVYGEYFIVSKSRNNEAWILKIINNEGIVSYGLYKDNKLEILYFENFQLAKYEVSEIEPMSFIARDGVHIEGYITFPLNVERKNLPLVLNVHGGPWARDIPTYISKETTWLSNRGFISLNVNFRGSTGYGMKFSDLGIKQWGKTMHDDLIDAVNWAIESGITSKDNVSIFGMSYGGYAVLIGLTLTPDVFCCGVDRVGPTDLIKILENMPPQWGVLRKSFYANMGDPVKDRDALIEVSPLYHVKNITSPLLVAQGKNDPRVDVSESDNIVEALKEKNIDYEYLLFEDEGHVFTKDKNVFEFYKKAETFLLKHHKVRRQ